MKRFERAPVPGFLDENWETWGKEWERRHSAKPPEKWTWHQYNKAAVNQLLLVHLKAQTQGHCSFCDAFPVSPPSDETIEHFRPKALYPLEAFYWPNLYLCCRFCQEKDGAFKDIVIRPDAPDYDFDRFFIWDFTLGTLNANPSASPEDQARAEFTIRFYRLNVGHPDLRLRELRRRSKDPEENIEDFAYRHFLGL